MTLKEQALDLRQKIISAVEKNGGHLSSNLGAVELTLAMHQVFDPKKDIFLFDVGHQCYTHKLLTNRSLDNLKTKGGVSGFLNPAESPQDSFITGHSSTALSLAAGYIKARTLKNQAHEIVVLTGDGALTGGLSYEALNDLHTSNKKVIIIVNDNGFYPVWIIKNLKERFDYIGEIDGHDIDAIIEALSQAKTSQKSIIIHAKTTKGKGVDNIEADPEKYHGVPRPCLTDLDAAACFSKTAANTLVEMADNDNRIVAVTAAMPHGTRLDVFSDKYPDRFFDVGICEAHAVTMSAALARAGLMPYAAIYSSFLQRGFDSVLHDVCIMNNSVRLLIDRAGLVPEDGETHQGVFDIGFLRILPNIKILAPLNQKELAEMMRWSLGYEGALAIRYPKGGCAAYESTDINAGTATRALVTTGPVMYCQCLRAKQWLARHDVDIDLYYVRHIKPLEQSLIKKLKGYEYIFTAEDNIIAGGLGSAILEALAQNGCHKPKVTLTGINDEFPGRGTINELLKAHSLDGESIAKKILV